MAEQDPEGHDTDDAAARPGLKVIDEVYGPAFRAVFADSDEPYLIDTVDHLFAHVWSRPGLSIRDRRLLTLGALAAFGLSDTFAVHAGAALRAGDLDAAQLHEIVLHLAYYAGAGNATAIRRGVVQAIADYGTH